MFNKLRDQLKNELFSNIMWSFTAKVSAMIFYFAADIFYARFLGITAYAEWVFFYSIAHMAFYIGWFGINTSLKIHITNSIEKETCLGAAIGVRVIVSIIMFLTINLAAPGISYKIGYPQPYPDLKILMYLMSGMVFWNSLTEFFKELYIGIQEYKNLCVITFIEYFLYCLFSISFLLINNSPRSIALGYCAAGIVIFTCNIIIASRKYNVFLIWKGVKNLHMQKKIITYAFPLVLTSLGDLVLMEMDIFMVGLFCQEKQVSAYSIAKHLTSNAMNVNMSIWTGTTSSLAMITKENFNKKKVEFKKINRLNIVTSLIICTCLAMFGKIAIQYVYGIEYIAASQILILLIPYYFLYCMASLYANFLDFMGHAKTRALWFISVISINLYFNYLLIPKYGAAGAAAATIISIVPYTIYCLYSVRNIFRYSKYTLRNCK